MRDEEISIQAVSGVPNRIIGWVSGSFAMVFLLGGCNPVPSSEVPQTSVLRIAAASDLKFAFEELEKAFGKAHPTVRLEPTFGASGTFFAQIVEHAPFDLFLSADEKYPRQLDEMGLVDGEPFLYAEGHLALWVPKDSPLRIDLPGLKVLLDDRIRKLAMANPKTAPYGRAAEESLKHAKLVESIQQKIVLGENASQTTQFAESGNVDAALIPLSHAESQVMREKGRYEQVPDEFHQPIRQYGVILHTCKVSAAAKSFQQFLKSPECRLILRRSGLWTKES